jgi:hypothetical protein
MTGSCTRAVFAGPSFRYPGYVCVSRDRGLLMANVRALDAGLCIGTRQDLLYPVIVQRASIALPATFSSDREPIAPCHVDR